ncbi:type 1 glutamine amidotransferase [Roseibacterium sp. SDUM158017]|uniref:type 1 glutamine amidotransferase domain-containing protein n=1 Tax=Roseicyclus salinarum TaxID=3036773 RepID=UPI002414FFD6|nr:type 1 glutamine amidotransferase domain-containing protein [Roseibacterium sp. SDUM158017]MDG4648088.1 type 1 glutamine amidotransferase [Roseibacterium sp. SDUM158017]
MPDIENAKILIISTHGFEQSELEVPRDTLRAKGATVHVATPNGKPVKGWDTDNWGREAEADLGFDRIEVADYDALVLPGGQINPDLLRVDDRALLVVRSFAEAGKPIAAICHAPWLLVEAGLAEGRRMTSYPSVRTDVSNAGAEWVDEAVVVDRGIVTSRNPGDLEAFVDKIVEEIEGGRNRAAA